MAHFHNPNLAGAGGQGGYLIDQSLRFDGSSYLTFTPASTAGTRRQMTFSFWSKHDGTYNIDNVFTAGAAVSYYDAIVFDSDTCATAIANSGGTFLGAVLYPAARLRDSSAWLHYVMVLDTPNATAADRMRIYINGVRVTAFSSSPYSPNADPGQNYDTKYWNTTATHRVGSAAYSGSPDRFFSGYLAEVHCVFGQALDPSSFGETDTITGAWIPKKYSGSYGTNGFYLKFDPSATNGIGHDHSGNGNNFTATGFSTSGTGTDVMSDTPTNNWCTLNPLNTYNNNTSNGNLSYSQTNSNNAVSQGTIGMPSGKWYWEINAANVGNGVYGITRYEYPTQAVYGCSNGYGTGFSPALNTAYINSSTGSSSYCSSPSAPASGTYMFAFDADARKFWMGVNGTWYTKTGGSAGDPGAGTNELFGTSDITAGVVYRALIGGSAVTTVSGDINFGQRAFAYTPPTGYKALSTGNLPEPTIKKGGDHFNTILWAGNNANPRTLNGVGFQPDWVWLKDRTQATNHRLVDAVRGGSKTLKSNLTDSETSSETAGTITAFISDGFTVQGTSTVEGVNLSGDSYVAWNWKANGAGSSNTAGTITSTVSANATAGFSIVTYTGNSTGGATIGHGLGVAPKMIIAKSRGGGTYPTADWAVYHESIGATKSLALNGSGGAVGPYSNPSTMWYNTTPTSNLFYVGNLNENNGNNNYVAYCFSEVAGYSKFGSYIGNGSSDGPFVFFGFKPRWLMIKRSDSTENWLMFDTARETYNPTDDVLWANLSNAESANYTPQDFTSNGFKIRTSSSSTNASGGTYIFAAFSETAFKYANAR